MELSLNTLSAAKRSLKAFSENKEGNLKAAERVLSYFTKADLKSTFQEHRKRKFVQAERVISDFKERQLNYFDIFRKVGFVANENSLSDAIAAMLDPTERHKLGVKPLLQVLEKLAEYNASKVKRLKNLIRENKSHIVLHRERHEGNTIPDIEIVCPDFLIFIENKIRGGSETIINGSWQTNRQWEALINRSHNLNIPEENLLAIYLTPEGKLPKNKHFIPFSVSELVSALRCSVTNIHNDDLKYSLFAFLNFYSWE
jgi:hypothetical protein